ncbi:uncharacterized protein LOC127838879 isoform X3 [Dreissena polymorpha]|uniref:uncharacterized protein LOC127838879 isoform X3 n=1 Tax=Dreissena polymorpha TaxID=45954 RepID=UPI002263B1EA|nr:uncharacterized protein LOC127838879 isoform X3 [Dreissena polymorpha]
MEACFANSKMDAGIHLRYRAECYPRYEYFKRRLKEFVPRLERIINASKCADYIHEASSLLEMILQEAKNVQDTVDIFVFREDVNVCTPEIAVKFDVTHSTQNRDSHQQHEDTKIILSKPEFVGIFPPSAMDDSRVETKEISWRKDQSMMKGFPCAVVVFVFSTDKCLQDLSNNTHFAQHDTNILGYNTTMETCYRTTEGILQRMTHEDTKSFAENIQRVFEEIIIDIFLKIEILIDKFSLRDGKTLPSSIDELLEERIRRILSNRLMMQEIEGSDKEHESSVFPETIDQSEPPKRTLIAVVKIQTRCTLVETLSIKNGLSQAVILSSLAELRFDDQLVVICRKVFVQKETEDFLKDIICKTDRYLKWKSNKFAQTFKTKSSKLFETADNYIQSKVEFIQKLNRLKFELHGILQMTPVHTGTVIPKIPSMDVRLQKEIMRVPNVQFCGHVYGKLTIYVTDRKRVNEKDIWNLLRKHNYLHGYKIQEVVSTVQAGSDIRCGHHLRVRGFGNCTDFSLGCFVHLDFGAGGSLDDVYAISCGHCICNGCYTVLASYRGHMHEFGKVDCLLDKSRYLDIVAIKVSTSFTKICNFNFKQPQHVETDARLTYYQGTNYDRLEVYKYGHGSGLTTGIVVSSDTVIKTVDDQENYHTDDFMYQILVEPMTDVTQGTPFSKKGDSGSIICVYGPANDCVEALALLCGSFEDRETKAYICTYGSHFERLITEFGRQCHMKVTLAHGRESTEEHTVDEVI